MIDFIGIDTSNYTTSVAFYDSATDEMHSFRRLLPVKDGEIGVRQSDAVFHHTMQLPMLFDEAELDLSGIKAVSVSTRPCDREGSYFPCFLVGTANARILAKTLGVPLFTNSHQQGHIVAVLYSAGRLDLANETFLAFHVSGGTTEAVLCTPDHEKIIATQTLAKSLDLNAGQAVDRVGHAMGLSFPSGKELEKLALQSDKKFKPKPFMREGCVSLSGLQNKCETMLKNGESHEDTARFCLDFITVALEKMMQEILRGYGEMPVVFSGGVMSNSIIRDYFTDKYSAVFALPEYSTDNAAGVAILGKLKY